MYDCVVVYGSKNNKWKYLFRPSTRSKSARSKSRRSVSAPRRTSLRKRPTRRRYWSPRLRTSNRSCAVRNSRWSASPVSTTVLLRWMPSSPSRWSSCLHSANSSRRRWVQYSIVFPIETNVRSQSGNSIFSVSFTVLFINAVYNLLCIQYRLTYFVVALLFQQMAPHNNLANGICWE